MNVDKVVNADVYRDGGSLAFWFRDDDGNNYEFFMKTRAFEKDPESHFHPPKIFSVGHSHERQGNREGLVESLTWAEAKAFVAPLRYNNERFHALVAIVKNDGNRE